MRLNTIRKIKQQYELELSELKVGDEIWIFDIADEAVFKVVHISKKYVYFMRKYALPTDLRHPVNEKTTNKGGFRESDLYQWLNNEYRDSLTENIRKICGEIFLPKECQIFGEHIYSDEVEKGKQWDFFKKPKNRIRVYQDTLKPANWWEASAHVGNSTHFCIVYTDGSADSGYASYSFGLVPCFRILREDTVD